MSVNRVLSMTLFRDLSTGVWYVEQVELRYGTVRNALRFSELTPIGDALSDDFVEQLRNHLPANLNQQIISVSGEAVSVREFIAMDMRILSQTALHGIQRVIVRFNRVLGRVFDFLIPEKRPDLLPVTLTVPYDIGVRAERQTSIAMGPPDDG
ncbi:MAG: hypothetical protein AAFQ66_14980 [Pseudomonadota bacterium]